MKTILVIAAILILALAALPAAASPPTDVTIVSFPDWSTFPVTGRFTASGSAVTAGVICQSGSVAVSVFGTGNGNGQPRRLFVNDSFTCDDGSGSFEIEVNRVYASAENTWHVVGGRGAYERLHGNGNLTPELDSTHDVFSEIFTGNLKTN